MQVIPTISVVWTASEKNGSCPFFVVTVCYILSPVNRDLDFILFSPLGTQFCLFHFAEFPTCVLEVESLHDFDLKPG